MMHYHDSRHILALFTMIHFDCLFGGASIEINCSRMEGDYKHWTWDPRTGDPRTREPEDRVPKDQGPNDLALLHLAFMTEMQLVSIF